ncbi:glycosyltransferase family 4 protein [Thalassotalea ganghwensis]
MKIGVVTTWFERGAAYVSKQIRDVLVKHGHEVFIFSRHFCPEIESGEKWNESFVTRAKRQQSPMPTDINKREFLAWIDRENIELVVFNEQHYWQPVIWAKEHGIKVVAYVDYYKEDTVEAFGIYDQIWCNTNRHYSVFEHFPQAKYIPWGTDVDTFIPQTTSNNASSEVVTFFHSAGMSPLRKGTDILILATEELAKKSTNFNVLLHTQVALEDHMPTLTDTIEALKNQGILTVVCETISAPGLYHLGDVYVYPSRLEGIGLTIAEALSVGLPTIVTNEAPMNEFSSPYCQTIGVEKRYARADGYYWPQAIASFEDLAEKMALYLTDYDFQKIKPLVREYAESKLSWQKNSQCLGDLVLECQSLPAPQASRLAADKIDQYKWPYFEKLRLLYYFAYDVHRLLKKLRSH